MKKININEHGNAVINGNEYGLSQNLYGKWLIFGIRFPDSDFFTHLRTKKTGNLIKKNSDYVLDYISTYVNERGNNS